VTCDLGDCRHTRAWKDANRQRHVEARLFDVLGERVIIVVDGMLMNYSVGMPMSDDMTMHPVMRVAENEAEIIVAGVSSRRFRCGNKHPLQRNGDSRHHHEDDGDASGQWLSSEAQTASLSVCRGQYPRGLYYIHCPGHSQKKSKPFRAGRHHQPQADTSS
jgi:hypothetical protein